MGIGRFPFLCLEESHSLDSESRCLLQYFPAGLRPRQAKDQTYGMEVAGVWLQPANFQFDCPFPGQRDNSLAFGTVSHGEVDFITFLNLQHLQKMNRTGIVFGQEETGKPFIEEEKIQWEESQRAW